MEYRTQKVIGSIGKLRFAQGVVHPGSGQVTTTDFVDHKDDELVVFRNPSGAVARMGPTDLAVRCLQLLILSVLAIPLLYLSSVVSQSALMRGLDLYWSHRNDAFNANEWFRNANGLSKRGRLVQNVFGGKS